MAKIKGCGGVLLVGATPTAVGELRTWEYEHDAAQEDISVMGDCDPAFADGPITTTCRATFFWNKAAGSDPAPDGGQALLIAGTSVDLYIRPNGTGTGKPQLLATSAFINTLSGNAEFAGRVQGTVSFTFGGLWDETAQS